jgi:hypothetical protein
MKNSKILIIVTVAHIKSNEMHIMQIEIIIRSSAGTGKWTTYHNNSTNEKKSKSTAKCGLSPLEKSTD